MKAIELDIRRLKIKSDQVIQVLSRLVLLAEQESVDLRALLPVIRTMQIVTEELREEEDDQIFDKCSNKCLFEY